MPQTIKEVIDSLSESDRRRLNYAFENGISQFLPLPNGKFVGVNIGHLNYLVPDLKVGRWAYGRDTSRAKVK